jgi:hypothetical protein
MNKQLKFNVGIGSTILAGVAAVNIRPIVRFIFINLRMTPPISEVQTPNIVIPSRSVATNLQAQTQAVTAFPRKELQPQVAVVFGDNTAVVNALQNHRANLAFPNSRFTLKSQELANHSLYNRASLDNNSTHLRSHLDRCSRVLLGGLTLSQWAGHLPSSTSVAGNAGTEQIFRSRTNAKIGSC